VDASQIRQRILDHYGIRIDPEMSQYVLRQLEQPREDVQDRAGPCRPGPDRHGPALCIPIMGGDARTGVAVRENIDPQQLRAS